MRTFITLAFWLTVFVVGLAVFIKSVFGLLPVFAVALFSPSLAIGLLVGAAVAARRH